MEEEKIDDISNKDKQYDVEYKNLRRTIRENDGIGVELLQTITKGKSYKSLSKKLQFQMNNNMCVKKKQEMMK